MISTNEIYYGSNTSLILTEELQNMSAKTTIVDNNTMLRALNETVNLQLSNGTFSGTFTDDRMEPNKVYLISIKYTKSNGLVDQSLYTLVYQPGVRLQSCYNLVKCYNGNDNFLVTLSGETLTLATQYTGSDTPTSATVRFV